MKKHRYKLICLLLILSITTGIIAGCTADVPASSQQPSGTTVPSVPTATTHETVPTDPSVPPTSEPSATEPPVTEPPVTEPPVTEPPVTEPAPPPPVLQAANGFIYDLGSRSFLYTSVPADTALYPASITKLFTAYVALEFLELSAEITIGKELSLVAWDASIAGLEKGSVWTVENLLYASLLPSGCDASYVLAVAAGRALLQDPDATIDDACKAFMAQCNFLALELGMENTHFVTPDGYHHEDHYISVMAYPIIAQCILENEALRGIVQTQRVTITYTSPSGQPRTTEMRNTNRCLRSDHPQFYRSEAVGLKTGSTTPAGGCLLAAYRTEESYVVVGVFGCPDKISRFSDANALFDYYLQLQQTHA